MHNQSMHRIRVDLAYDGTGFHGWARQPGLPTVQATIEDGLFTIFRQPVATTVAGRTDAGVHAANQVIHFDIPTELWAQLPGHHPSRPAEAALVSKLNGVLAKESGAIRIRSARVAPKGFDARFSPISRRYRYLVALGEPDPLTRHFTYHHRKPLVVDRMVEEIDGLTGLHDFRAFCKPRPGATTIRTLQEFRIDQDEAVFTIHLTADAFCHHMVRALVGALLRVGDGAREPGWLRNRLANPVRDSNMVIAPAHGLILDRVTYPEDDQVAQRAIQTRAKRDPRMLTCD
ncbi:tRNA pseudouridine(38-40) synthase TruA [Enteractinococcus coprophilus]|uniref:tRNA pseudouridine synthase A n=1 Tax=Enteractinococcus coprophilus TaxID=1027633 RepID=A0A543A0N0_9MICC|nr:tRNA pseudouridine(38-40) synthase TruA [Enteractinococcus coprophilus]TQL66114.1 tRNA pseudouridine38-40 synthase [Enteractinococcus coprophilus]